MSQETAPIERSVTRRMANAIHGMAASKFLGDTRGPGRYAKCFSAGFCQALWSDVVRSSPWRSVYAKPLPQTARERAEIAITSFALHIHPASMPRKALKFSVTYGLGGFSAALFITLYVTGVMLMFYYVPATNHAYKDMVDLQHVVSLGRILRNVHRWSAHLMVLVVAMHMLRVFLQKAYSGPRKFNWMVGVFLMVATLLLSFTGYLLPWDQLAYWAVTVGTNMAGAVPLMGEKIRYVLLGGATVDQATLIRFYVLHCLVLPLVVTAVMGYHFWRVRKDGFSGGLDVKH